MSAREEILAKVGAALGRTHRAVDVPWTYAAPAAVKDIAALFVERVEDYRATVIRTTADGLAAAIAAAVGGAASVVVPAGLPTTWLDSLPDVVLRIDDQLSADSLEAIDGVITAAAVGIATTGTIVLDHGPDQGRRALSLVPDLHVCVITESQVLADVPEAVARLEPAIAAGRPLTWISGPSATSDIELERIEGVHGPRDLHVVLVAD